MPTIVLVPTQDRTPDSSAIFDRRRQQSPGWPKSSAPRSVSTLVTTIPIPQRTAARGRAAGRPSWSGLPAYGSAPVSWISD
jgi:hypothetical protein